LLGPLFRLVAGHRVLDPVDQNIEFIRAGILRDILRDTCGYRFARDFLGPVTGEQNERNITEPVSDTSKELDAREVGQPRVRDDHVDILRFEPS